MEEDSGELDRGPSTGSMFSHYTEGVSGMSGATELSRVGRRPTSLWRRRGVDHHRRVFALCVCCPAQEKQEYSGVFSLPPLPSVCVCMCVCCDGVCVCMS